MMQYVKRSWIFLLILCFLAGCNAADNSQQSEAQGTSDDQYTIIDESQEVAERLATLANRVEQVNDSTAIVAGRWAVVGIDVDAKLDRSRVGTIKYSVAEALKDDPVGAYAVVTADIDTNYRLKQMAQEIRNGEPVEGFMEELAAILGRIMPQFPKQIEEPEVTPEEEVKGQQDENQIQRQQIKQQK